MPIRPYILAESNWKDIRNSSFDLAILPWGATEAHNLHLPYRTDIFEADYFAAASAEVAHNLGAKVIVLPAIPFGVNTGQADILLDMNLNPSTQAVIIGDVITTLDRQGIKKLLILNSHGGNDFKSMLREIGLQFPEMHLSACNWFQAVPKQAYFTHDGDHADEMETSMMLLLRPDLVLPLSEAGEGHERKHVIEAFREKWAWTERPWSKITEDTGVGNPKDATKEKGEHYAKAVIEKIGQFIYDLATTDINKLYQ
jgi:creatinine amidohydrolase